MSNTTPITDEATVSHDAVTVTRRLTQKGEGIIGTIDITPTGQKPVVLVHLVDEFPTDLPVDAAGFKPDQEPEMGNVTPQRVSIKQTVESDPVQIEYGITLSEPVETVQFDSPTIQGVETATMTRSAASHTDEGERAAANTSGTDKSSKSVSSLLPGLGRDSARAEHPDEHQLSDEMAETQSTKVTETDGTGADGASNAAIESAVQQAVDPGATNNETGETEPASGEGQVFDGEPEATYGRGVTAGSPARGDESPTSAERTAREPDEKTEQGKRRSVGVRIDRLNARIEEFAAYADALEDLIDDHGTAPEFIDRTERDLADLDARVESIRQEVNTVEETHDEDVDDLREKTDGLDRRIDSARQALETELGDLRGQVGVVHSEVDRVDAAVERIDTELADQGSAVGDIEGDLKGLDDRVTGVEDGLHDVQATIEAVENDVAAVSDDVRAMREELESLRGAVESLNEFRDSLAYAFEAPADTTASSDD
ncbi:hypothetical protein ACFQE8_23275 [Salinirubellus sp. GCM10025818]|uniref:hypothetical protein n=1 Tax=Salinirubellus TaxID=2162630 RepID=UPI0030CFA727